LEAVVEAEAATRHGAPAVLDVATFGADDGGAHGVTGGGEEREAETAPNVSARVRFQEGDAAAGLAASAFVARGRYRIPAVHQGFLEPHVAIAEAARDGSITIWTPTQGSFSTRSTVAAQLRF